MLVSVAVAFVVATSLSGGCLWAIAKWSGVAAPLVDLLIIAGLCSGLALLPWVGWVLASMFMALLVTRTTEADPWPDAVLMVVGSNVAWLLMRAMLPGWA
jgi:hypothetical protein